MLVSSLSKLIGLERVYHRVYDTYINNFNRFLELFIKLLLQRIAIVSHRRAEEINRLFIYLCENKKRLNIYIVR